MTGILLCWLTRFMFEREQRAILQWPFMPCEKYTSLLVRLMKALSCPPPPQPPPHPPAPPVEVYRNALSGARSTMCRSKVFVLFKSIRKQSSMLVQVCATAQTCRGEPTLLSYAPPPPPITHPPPPSLRRSLRLLRTKACPGRRTGVRER